MSRSLIRLKVGIWNVPHLAVVFFVFATLLFLFLWWIAVGGLRERCGDACRLPRRSDRLPHRRQTAVLSRPRHLEVASGLSQSTRRCSVTASSYSRFRVSIAHYKDKKKTIHSQYVVRYYTGRATMTTESSISTCA